MVMTEVDIGFRAANFLHITMVEYTLTTQGFTKNPIQGGAEGKTPHKNHPYYSYPQI